MKVCVGRIRKPHGINGMVLIEPYTLSPDFFTKKHRVFYIKNNVEFPLLDPKIRGNAVISRIMGYIDRDSVEKFNNEELYVDRTSLPILEENEYYFEDLKDMSIVDINQTIMGKVIDVCDYGGGVFLEIKTNLGKIATISFNDQSILVVDLKNFKIIVNSKMLLV